MPLSAPAMATAIQTEIVAQFGAPQDAARLSEFAMALANAIVTQIQTTAVVQVIVPGGSSAGTHTGVIL